MTTLDGVETLFTGGRVFGCPGADSVLVRDDRIAEVGSGLSSTSRGETVDLRGRLILPGFQDAHVHAVLGGLELGLCDLTSTTSVPEYQRLVRIYADSSGGELVSGGGWSMESFPGGVPDKGLLDAVVPDRPVFLMNRDHHGAWVNSAALRRAGITAATPDPPHGRIDRGPDGEPAGGLQEGAMALVADLMPAPTAADRLAGLLRAQTLLHSLGVTAWQDAMVGGRDGYPDVTDAYLTAAADGSLISRVEAALWWERGRGAEQIAALVAAREALTRGPLRANTVKFMLDGVAENFTAAMLGPYRGDRGDGLLFIPPGELAAHVTAVDALGFQAHFHALGDRAVRVALDAVAAARAANGFRDTRPHLAHLQVVHPAEVRRFAALDATANLQALWAAHEPQMDELTIPFLPPGAAERQYPFGDLHRAGARLAAGSDWPVSTPDPLQAAHVAVNRRHDDGPAFLPRQRLDLATFLTACTAGSAYVNHRDDDSGVVRPGYRADLVVLDRDPFAGPADQIGETRVELTYVAGSRVFAAA
jgi:predicted amidohydrolase YtcJ